MVKIDYLCELFENQLPLLYTLMQSDISDVFYVCVGDQLIGTINKVKDGWEQVGGREMPNEFIGELGSVIERQCMPSY
ncbi:hypothetical protein [Pedobacter frigiditerrae]|uniref:hypothetical protein n=1 Tax=Pedobacter frigiditerrae TaxID=2530452 RepID=UPI00103A5C9E|nr:hypothetical protein [Pedobacter frigiditerrae]